MVDDCATRYLSSGVGFEETWPAKIKIPVESKTLQRELSSLENYISLKQLRGAWHTGHLKSSVNSPS